VIHSIYGISWIQFINLGLVLLFVSLNFELRVIPNPKYFLQGKYDNLSAKWYMDFGSIII